MFRPITNTAFPYSGPFRILAAALLILGFLVSVILILALEHEKFVLQGLLQNGANTAALLPALLKSRQDLIAVTVAVFLLSAVVIVAFVSYMHYGTVRRRLEEVKGLARNILERVPMGVLTVTQEGILSTMNPAAEAILRRSHSDLLGREYSIAFAEGDAIRNVIHLALRKAVHACDRDIYYESGDGGSRTVRVTTAPLSGDEMHRSGVILQVQDITEWRRLEERVLVAERLGALHTLSAGLAHELKNPLSALDLNLHLLEEEMREAGAYRASMARYLTILDVECRRLNAIVENFLTFARPGGGRQDRVDLKAVISHLGSLLQQEAEGRDIGLEIQLSEDLPAVLGDETQISQVLLNVLVNALEATPRHGLCRIAATRGGERDQDWIEVTVQDTGAGISKDIRSRVFEPFFTTKPSGSGLGLAIAYRIIQNHGGSIQIDSEEGSGTRVAICLPTAPAPQHLEAVRT